MNHSLVSGRDTSKSLGIQHISIGGSLSPHAACDPSTKAAQAPSAVGVGSEVSLGIPCAAQSPCNIGTAGDAGGAKGMGDRKTLREKGSMDI